MRTERKKSTTKQKKKNNKTTNNTKNQNIHKSKNIIVIDVNEIHLNSRKFTTSEIGRGAGSIKPKKGKGSYKRKKGEERRLYRNSAR